MILKWGKKEINTKIDEEYFQNNVLPWIVVGIITIGILSIGILFSMTNR